MSYVRFDPVRITDLNLPRNVLTALLSEPWNAADEEHEDVVQALEMRPSFIIISMNPEHEAQHLGFATRQEVERALHGCWQEAENSWRPLWILRWDLLNLRYDLLHFEWKIEWKDRKHEDS